MCVAEDDTFDTCSWFEILEGEGLKIFCLYNFVDLITLFLTQNYPGRLVCFTMDNLNICQNPLVLQLIIKSGHQFVIWAPHWSFDRTIENLLNAI